MNKREATKLRRGDVVLWGLSQWSAKCDAVYRDEVARVTPRGGILTKRGAWVPYHYGIQVERSAAV